MRRLRRWLLVPLGLALVAARQVASDYDEALRRLDANDPARAAELLAPWCERHPDDANGWLALGSSLAQSQRRPEAMRALTRARSVAAGREPEVAARASFDLARVLFEKAEATPRAGLPGDRRPEAGLVADVRTRLALIRFELETARDLLLDRSDAAPGDDEARRGLAAVSELLRTVVAEDAEWRKKGEPPRPEPLGQGTPASGPLKPGPSGQKSSAGANGKRSGAAAGGANASATGTPAEAGAPRITPAPLGAEEAAQLEAALRRVREERERADERRADAQAASRPMRSW